MRLKSAAIRFAAIVSATVLAHPAPAAPDQTRGVAFMSAVVATDGKLVDGTGVESSVRIATGSYLVTFVRDIDTKCAVIANIFNTSGFASPIEVGNVVNVVNVGTRNISGVISNLPFSLFVFCPR